MKRSLLGILFLPAFGLLPTPAFASANVVIVPVGAAFQDPTPKAPVGGNMGTTLGAQRLNALQYAAELWGKELDSEVPIVIEVSFVALGCQATGAVLAHAGPASAISGLSTEGADPDLWYPAPLANRLARTDLWPSDPDIIAEFNSDVDTANCAVGGFYYGLDGKGGAGDVVEVALHEFGHGLGFTSYTDATTGQLIVQGELDTFTSHLVDVQENRSWSSMTDAQRAASAQRVRGVAWDGQNVTKAMRSVLAPGFPALSLTPAVAGFSGLVSDTGFSSFTGSRSGSVTLGSPLNGCIPPSAGSLNGKVVVYDVECSPDEVARAAESAGAVGVVLSYPSNLEQPAAPFPTYPKTVSIPVVTVTPGDLALIENALSTGPLSATVTLDMARRKGEDPNGRMLMFTSKPLMPSSSLSHFDLIARPDLLMEPFAAMEAKHDVDLTLPLLHDIGWTPFCGNARIDQDEVCDQGSSNSDVTPDACRTTCAAARCGDRVVDSGEQCDDGPLNSDSGKDACRVTCVKACCGDGVVDSGEACDQGALNSDTMPDACRVACQLPRCGDGVVDRGEACDSSADCDTSCRLPPKATDGADTNGSSGPLDMNVDSATADERSAKDDGCGCSVPGQANTPPLGALSLGMFGAMLAWRRRRARKHGA